MKINFTKLYVTYKHEPSHKFQRKIAILRETSIERNVTKSVKKSSGTESGSLKRC